MTTDPGDDVLEHLPCGYVAASRTGRIRKVNGTLVRLVGRTREELVGELHLPELFTVGCRIHYETHFAPLLEMQGFVEQIAVDVKHADGRVIPALLNAVRRTDANGATTEIHATLVDVSDRKSYEKELLAARAIAEKAAQVRADFVSMFSHEIRNPLNAIMSAAHLLASTNLDASQTRLVKVLRRSTDNLLGLVNDVLDYSKIEAGKVTLEARKLDVREVVSGVVQAFEAKATEKGLTIHATFVDAVPRYVVGDPVKLGQILTNLVGNATKFTLTGRVDVRVQNVASTADDVRLRFSVIDTGIGIGADRIRTIFEDYAQGGDDIEARFGGTGLGLAIVRRLVELHGNGSRIEVDSAPGKGSTFWFELTYPTLDGDEIVEGEEEPAEVEPGLRGLRALVVDDDEVNLLVLKELLESWGMTVATTTSAREAIDQADDRVHDVILMDLRIPELDGYTAAKAIRARGGRLATLPIIAVSGSMRMGAMGAIEAAGFTGFVGKPIRPDVLAAEIRKHTRQPR